MIKELLDICTALEKLDGKPCALATIISVEGSAYRRPGARMLITPDGKSWGMISGGCLEQDVLEHARHVLQCGTSRVVRYDFTSEDDIVFGTGLGCNGIIDVLIEPVTESFRESLIEAVGHCQRSRQPGAIATVVQGGERSHAFLTSERWIGAEILKRLLENEFFESEETILFSAEVPNEKTRVFIQPLLPPVQLVIFGGWLDVLPLIRIAQETGFQTVVVDSRQRESSPRFFHEAGTVLLCSPAEALEKMHFDARTVAVLMNHHFERDQEALAALTQVSLPFIGMLGPKRRQQKMLESMKKSGVFFSDDFARSLHGPVGLDIGAKSPGEIALSIMAEILAVLNKRNAKPIRDRLAPLHASPPALAYA